MSNDDREPDASAPDSSRPLVREDVEASSTPDQADARAELANVLEDLDGYGER